MTNETRMLHDTADLKKKKGDSKTKYVTRTSNIQVINRGKSLEKKSQTM